MNTVSKFIAAGLVATGLAGGTLAYAATDKANKAPLTSDLTIEQVSAIALKAQPGTIEEIELERKDGKVVFEVEVKTDKGEVEVLVDATSGQVLAMEADDDDDGDRD